MAKTSAVVAAANVRWQNQKMNSQEKDRLLEEAARWSARLASPECTAVERRAFEAWRGLSPAHGSAWAMANRVDRQLGQFATGNAELQAMAEAAFSASSAPRRRDRRRRLLALAAGLAAVGLFAAMTTVLQPQPGKSIYESADAADGRRSLTLDDGSAIEMDVGSAVEVEMTAAERRIVLLRGRALFQVAHDAGRPFSVVAGEARTVALGTRFQVDRRGDAIAVTLAEGSISVTGLGGLDGRSELLHPGEQLRYGLQPLSWSKHEVDLQVATGWERGRLVFHGAPLAEVLTEVNLYADRPLRIADSSLAMLPVSGNFIAGNSNLVASALVQTLPISAVQGDREIVLSSRKD